MWKIFTNILEWCKQFGKWFPPCWWISHQWYESHVHFGGHSTIFLCHDDFEYIIKAFHSYKRWNRELHVLHHLKANLESSSSLFVFEKDTWSFHRMILFPRLQIDLCDWIEYNPYWWSKQELCLLYKEWIKSIISILDYFHKCGIHHNDIKPENFMISQSNHLSIIDMSCGQIYPRNYLFNQGSVEYMAPEVNLQIKQLRKCPFVFQSNDLYSATLTIIAFFASHEPFFLSNQSSLQNSSSPLYHLSDYEERFVHYIFSPCLQPDWKVFLKKMLTLLPENRLDLTEWSQSILNLSYPPFHLEKKYNLNDVNDLCK